MRAYILKGNDVKYEGFIDKFKSENKVEGYNLHVFDQVLKIAEAREIKKILSRSTINAGNRLIIIAATVTMEAQNALLKTIEELPEKSFIVFLNARDLLATIYSRCTVVDLGASDVSVDDGFDVLSLLDNSLSPSGIIVALDAILRDKDIAAYEKLILSLRRELMAAVEANDLKKTRTAHGLVRMLADYLPRVNQNNLNPKIIGEKTLLAAVNLR